MVKKISMDYHDLNIFQQIKQKNKEEEKQKEESDKLDANVFDNLQILKNQLKSVNKPKKEKLVIIDGSDKVDETILQKVIQFNNWQDYNLREQIFPEKKECNQISIFMLFTRLITKIAVD